MYFRNLIGLLIFCLIFLCLPVIAMGNASVESLVGLWKAERNFGPEVRGELTICRKDSSLVAKIAGFIVPVTVQDNTLHFLIPGDRGEFRGSLSRDLNDIEGHWIQPATKSASVRYASPVTLGAIDANRWRGQVVPKSDILTFFLKLEHSASGTIKGYVRNPQANFGRFFPISGARIDGDNVVFLGAASGETTLVARVDSENEVMSIYLPSLGGTYDFHRVDSDTACAFYPRPTSDTPYRYTQPLQEDDGWEVASLPDVGMEVGPIENLVQTILDTPMDSVTSLEIHALLIVRHGKLVLEEYFHGYSRTVPHDTRSASKSITSNTIGTAIHNGEPLSLSMSVCQTIYGDDLPSELDPRKMRITLRHLLTMSSGLACNDWDDDSPGNEDRMQNQHDQPDWTQYTLDLPMACEPGDSVWYCSGSPNLAAAVLSKATGEWLPDLFFREVARPMQLGLYHMNLTPTGEAYGGGGLYLQARDFLKFGQLFLSDGTWNGQRLLDKDWVRDAVSPMVNLGGEGYGYNWWVIDYPYREGKIRAFYAGGNGGQYVIGVPDLDLVILFFAGNYSQSVMHKTKREYVPQFILKAIK